MVNRPDESGPRQLPGRGLGRRLRKGRRSSPATRLRPPKRPQPPPWALPRPPGSCLRPGCLFRGPRESGPIKRADMRSRGAFHRFGHRLPPVGKLLAWDARPVTSEAVTHGPAKNRRGARRAYSPPSYLLPRESSPSAISLQRRGHQPPSMGKTPARLAAITKAIGQPRSRADSQPAGLELPVSA